MPAEAARFSPAAAEDLREIQSHTLAQWGPQQWRRYLVRLENLFEQLADNPALGTQRDEVRAGLRSMPVGAHVVWYRIHGDIPEIVRVLHGAMDPDAHL